MSDLIQLSEAISALTTQTELRKKLQDDYRYHSIRHKLTYDKSKTTNYQVNANEFYDWIKDKHRNLKANIPEEYRRPTRCFATSEQSYDLLPPPSITKFNTLEEATYIIQILTDEKNELINKIEDMTKEFNEALSECKKKADKWDDWNKTKRRPRVK